MIFERGETNNQKIDDPLAAAIKNAKPFQKFSVLLRTEKGNFTGVLSAEFIKEFSNQSWCTEIRLLQNVPPLKR